MKIVIGDHWAIGPISNSDNGVKIVGPGIANYLAMHEPVLVVTKAWSHMLEQLEMFQTVLQNARPSPEDEIIWVLPDPFVKWTVTDYEYLLDGAGTIKDGVDAQIERFLIKINDLAEEYNMSKVKIVGGNCDLSHVTIRANLPRLMFPVPSWCKLLEPDFFSTPFNETSLSNLSGWIVSHRPDLMEELGKVTDAVKQRRKSILKLQNSREMTGDIDAMPTSIAHKKLFVNLFPTLSL